MRRLSGACLMCLGLLLTGCVSPAAAFAPGALVAAISLPVRPSGGLAVDADGVWLASDSDGTLARIDPRSNQVVTTIALGDAGVCSFCVGGAVLQQGTVWTTSNGVRMAVVAVDPAQNQVRERIPLSLFPSTMITGDDGSLWFASLLDSTVERLDPQTHHAVARIDVPRASHLASGAGAVWAISHRDDSVDGAVVRIDPRTNVVAATIDAGAQPVALAASAEGVWVVDQSTHSVERIDPAADALVATVPVGSLPTGITIDGQDVWVVSLTGTGGGGAALSLIRADTDTLVGNVDLGRGTPTAVVVGDGSIWVTMRDPDSLLRIRPAAPNALPVPLLGAALLLLCVGIVLWLTRSGTERRLSTSHFEDLRRFAASRGRHEQ